MTREQAKLFAVKVLQRTLGKDRENGDGWEAHGYRRPGRIMVHVYTGNNRDGFLVWKRDFVFEGDDFEELKALAMQRALEKV